jgi:hypothetical protein
MSIGVPILFAHTAGAQWAPTGLDNGDVVALAASDSAIFAGTNTMSGVFLSANHGVSWTAADSGLKNIYVMSFTVSNGTIFAEWNGVFLSANNGASWTQIFTDPHNVGVSSLAVSGNNLFAGTRGDGIYLSTGNDKTWIAADSGLTDLTDSNVLSLGVSGGNVLAGTAGGVFLSANNGASWTAADSGLPKNAIVQSFVVNGGDIFAGTEGNGIFLSANNGTSWTAVNAGLRNTTVQSLAVGGGAIFAGTYSGGVFLSVNNGASWTAADSGLTNLDILSLAVSGGYVFAGTDSAGVWCRPLSDMISGVIYDKPQQTMLNRENLRIASPSHGNPVAIIEFSLPYSDHVTVSIYNLSGHEIASLVNTNLGQGHHSIPWNTRDLATGCYTVRLQAGANTCVKSVPIFR